jgi:hypothetical protein
MNGIIEHLKMVAAVRGIKPQHIKYLPEEFLLAYGREWKITNKTFVGKRGIPKNCYGNAASAVDAYSNLFYCEGYALGIIPFEHAWLVDAEGNVIDPTMKAKHAPTAYFGVAFNREYLYKTLLKNKVYGLLNGMFKKNRELYTGEAKDWAADLTKLEIVVS